MDGLFLESKRMKNNSQLPEYFRTSVLVGWGFLWNTLFGAAIWINRGIGQLHEPLAQKLVGVTLLGTSLFALSVLLLPFVRVWVLRPGKHINPIRAELWFIVVISGILGVVELSPLIQITD
ncbi:MAG: hypothetical protein F6J87_04895 [Spirulina sp. SIO3F2]|nr:hypothetical protein [Spirulina sp. SIO3F2]